MNSLAPASPRSASKLLGLALAAALSACGGGGGSSSPPEATITVSAGQVIVPSTGGAVELAIPITFSKATVASNIALQYSTVSTAKAGLPTGSPNLDAAVAGSSCATAGVDYIRASGAVLNIAAGSTSSKIPISVCPNSAFAPIKTFVVNWSSPTLGVSGAVKGSLINTVEGGLASTGSKTGIGGTATFGRDTNVLTNSDADGHAGLAYVQQPSSTNWKCTHDAVTGLSWEVKADATALNATYKYSDLAAYVAQVNAAQPCGLSNWRLPTVGELSSIVDSSLATGAAADAFGFPSQKAEPYWSGESMATASGNAWAVDFGNQGAASGINNKVTALYRVLLVNAPTPAVEPCNAASSRYVVNADASNVADGTVTDVKTGLMWKQCTEGSTGALCLGGTVSAFTTVQQVLDRVALVNNPANIGTLGLGYSDWRVPTRNELASLVNRACSAPAINTAVFPNTDQRSYLSATNVAGSTTLLWAVDFSDGGLSPVDPATAGGREIRLVRAGR